MGAARSLGRHWLGTWFEAKQACGVGEMAHRYALVARTAKGNTAEPQQVGTWRMDGRARTHRRGFLLSNPLQTKMGMGTWLEACHVGEMASRQGSQCFTLPLRLPLSQSRGVGGYDTDTDSTIQTDPCCHFWCGNKPILLTLASRQIHVRSLLQ